MNPVEKFEQKIAEFFGAPYAVGCDSATHGLELALILRGAAFIEVPKRTYVSVAMLANKLRLECRWTDLEWADYYPIYPDIYDAATLWRKDSYLPGTIMVISFQYSKHLSIGRCGVILTDKYLDALELKKMSYDGREPNIKWRDQDIAMMGYHYYLQPELAEIGLKKLEEAIHTPSKIWTYEDYPDISKMEVFK